MALLLSVLKFRKKEEETDNLTFSIIIITVVKNLKRHQHT